MKSERMTSFFDRIQGKLFENKRPEAEELLLRGLKYYTNRVIRGISPYAQKDAGILAKCLRDVAASIEESNPGSKELRETLDRSCSRPELKQRQVIERANKS